MSWTCLPQPQATRTIPAVARPATFRGPRRSGGREAVRRCWVDLDAAVCRSGSLAAMPSPKALRSSRVVAPGSGRVARAFSPRPGAGQGIPSRVLRTSGPSAGPREGFVAGNRGRMVFFPPSAAFADREDRNGLPADARDVAATGVIGAVRRRSGNLFTLGAPCPRPRCPPDARACLPAERSAWESWGFPAPGQATPPPIHP